MSDSSLCCCRHTQEGTAQFEEHSEPGHHCTAAVYGNLSWLYILSAQCRHSHSTANEDSLCACECAADCNTDLAVFDRLSVASVTALTQHALSMVGFGCDLMHCCSSVYCLPPCVQLQCLLPLCSQIATHSNLAGDAGVTAVYMLQCML